MLCGKRAKRLPAVTRNSAKAAEGDESGLFRYLLVSTKLHQKPLDKTCEPAAVLSVGLFADLFVRQWLNLIEEFIATVKAVYLVRFGKLNRLTHTDSLGVISGRPVAAQSSCL